MGPPFEKENERDNHRSHMRQPCEKRLALLRVPAAQDSECNVEPEKNPKGLQCCPSYHSSGHSTGAVGRELGDSGSVPARGKLARDRNGQQEKQLGTVKETQIGKCIFAGGAKERWNSGNCCEKPKDQCKHHADQAQPEAYLREFLVHSCLLHLSFGRLARVAAKLLSGKR